LRLRCKDSADIQVDSEEEEFRDAAAQINKRKSEIKKISQEKNKLQNRPVIPRKKKSLTLSGLTEGMRDAGHNPAVIEKRAARLMAQKKAEWEAANERDKAAHEAAEAAGDMDVDMDDGVSTAASTRTTKGKRGGAIDRTPRSNRQLIGMATREQDLTAVKLRKLAQREPNRLAKASESDRHVPITRPKWMLAGKRKGGKTDRR
jgi:nucleolar GTP-binding protein